MAEDLEEDMDGQTFDEGMGGGEHAASSGTLKRILFIAVPILLLVGGGVAAYFAHLFDPVLGMFKSAPKPVAADQIPAAVFYDMPEMLVNLSAQGRLQNFLKIRVSLELASSLDIPKIEAVMPRIVDNFQVYLRELRVEDLQGSAGMLRLREELLNRVNVAVKPAKVNDVLFKEMLVQ